MIPEKWCIQRNHENYQILNKWNNEHPLFKEQGRETANHIPTPNSSGGDYFFPDGRHYSPFATSCPKGYTLITTEQFIEFVLNKIEVYAIY